MCGIAGIFSHGSRGVSVSREELLAIRDAMLSRGPDGAGLWMSPSGRVGLAHRRLSIIDLSEAGSQPMGNGDGTVQIIFNGEIYNYLELRTGLEAAGHRFRSHSDTEVLLKMYERHGDKMLPMLRGMYAFAIYDARDGSLFLARDPFGIKPLYYSDDGAALRFASQVKALLRSPAIDRSPEAAGHVGFFLWGSVPEPYTLYRGIRALPAGTSMKVDSQGRRTECRFTSIEDELAESERFATSRHDERETLEVLRAATLDSVRHHLVADVPVGVFLSSGIDSTVLAALARETGLSALRTVTLGFNEYRGTTNDETPLAEAVARQLDAKHETCWISRQEFVAERESILAAMDQPSVDGVNTYFVSKVAAQAGLKVALSGLGGDEVFRGYPSFRDVPRLVRWLSPFSGLRRFGRGFRYVSAPFLRRFTSPKYAGLLEYGGSWGGAYLLRRGLFMPWELPAFLDPGLVRAGWDELQPLARLEHDVNRIKSPQLKVSSLELSWYMRNQLLRDSDWASMAHSLEIRVPFVDLVFIRTVAALSMNGQSVSKTDLVRVPAARLPTAVINRPKTGFSVPVREWLMQNDNRPGNGRGLRGWARHVYATA